MSTPFPPSPDSLYTLCTPAHLPLHIVASSLAQPSLKHGFFGRLGGRGTGFLTSLNTLFKEEEDPATTLFNRQLICDAMGFPLTALCLCAQVHGATPVVVSAPQGRASLPMADALVTKTRGLLLGIMTADCAPILLADRHHGVIAAVHAGWRGALSGIVQQTVHAMVALGATPSTLTAVIGPCIGALSYVVRDDVRMRFLDGAPQHDRFFHGQGHGQYRFDLPSYLRTLLVSFGISCVCLPFDTCSQGDVFFSHRRSMQLGEPTRGNQLSVIGMV